MPHSSAPLPGGGHAFLFKPASALTPYGFRGDRPVWVQMSFEQAQLATQIPGVHHSSGGIVCGWDAIPAISSRLRIPVPQFPAPAAFQPPGLDDYVRLGLHLKARPYQPDMSFFLMQRTMALNGDPMRVGKTFETLAAIVAMKFRRVLILCPALAKPVWASQIAEFLGEEALILYGRGQDEARWFCKSCMGSGLDAAGAECKGCWPYESDQPVQLRHSHGDRLVRPMKGIGSQQQAVMAAIEQARFVICNFDLLTPQGAHDEAGGRLIVDHLPGWSAMLTAAKFDLVVGDEIQYLRGRSNFQNQGRNRRDRAVMTCDPIPYAWGLSGTPFFGRTADGWGVIDWITNGLFGRPGRDFDREYAGGRWVKDEANGVPKHWEAKGMEQPDELKARIATFCWIRERKVIVPHMPRKTRTVIRVEIEGNPNRGLRRTANAEGFVADALRATAELKVPYVVEDVVAELSEGNKVLVVTYLHDNANTYFEAIKKALNKGEMKARAKMVNASGWLITGNIRADRRKPIADALIRHPGAGFCVATMESIPGMLSFKGITTTYFADLHNNPSVLLQVEDRGYDVDVPGYQCRYYIARGTVDEHIISLVVPKMEMKEKLENSSEAAAFKRDFMGESDPAKLAEQIMERMLKNLEGAIL